MTLPSRSGGQRAGRQSCGRARPHPAPRAAEEDPYQEGEFEDRRVRFMAHFVLLTLAFVLRP